MPNAPFDLADNIIAQLGLSDLPDDRKQELLTQMTELVEKQVTLRILETLSDEQAAEAEKLADDPEKLWAFYATAIPNLDEVIAGEIEALRAQISLETNPDTA